MKPRPKTYQLQRTLWRWFAKHQRDLPWRHTHNPYLIAVSEVMLQQTQVERVIPKYIAWRRAWPTVKSLAQAPLRDVLQLWSGLGYNSRAVRLRTAARMVDEHLVGHWPKTAEDLEQLPGFGPYTARAIVCFAYNQDQVVIDTNVRRIISRVFYGLRSPVESHVIAVAENILPSGRCADWYSALMDFGSIVCTSSKPDCLHCPLQRMCRAYPAIIKKQKIHHQRIAVRFHDSDRYWRGAIVRLLIMHDAMTIPTLVRRLHQAGKVSEERIVRLVKALERDEIIFQNKRRVRLAH